MARVTIVFGVILILLGVGSYGLAAGGVIGDRASPTALIPAAFGLLLVIFGAVGVAKPSANKHVMHGAVLVGLLGLLGTVGGAIKLIRYTADALPADTAVRLSAWVAQSIMAVLMVIFIALCVRSFIAARKARAVGFEPVPASK